MGFLPGVGFDCFTPSPLEGEGWDEGGFLKTITPHPSLSLKGRGFVMLF
jgi:hypothetical protein